MNNIFLTDDVNKQVCIFNKVFSSCLEMCAAIVSKAVKGAPAPWMGDDIREAMKDRDELQRQLKADTNNVDLWEHYRAAKTYVKTLNRSKAEH